MTRLATLAPELEAIDPAILSEIAEDAHYAPYVARQDAELRSLAANEAILLDPALDYGVIGGLSREMVERLTKARPETLGRSEEHTSELQSLMRTSYAVFCSKKKNNI